MLRLIKKQAKLPALTNNRMVARQTAMGGQWGILLNCLAVWTTKLDSAVNLMTQVSNSKYISGKSFNILVADDTLINGPGK